MSIVGLLLFILVVVAVVAWLQSAPIKIPPIVRWVITGIVLILLIVFIYENIGLFHLSNAKVVK